MPMEGTISPGLGTAVDCDAALSPLSPSPVPPEGQEAAPTTALQAELDHGGATASTPGWVSPSSGQSEALALIRSPHGRL